MLREKKLIGEGFDSLMASGVILKIPSLLLVSLVPVFEKAVMFAKFAKIADAGVDLPPLNLLF